MEVYIEAHRAGEIPPFPPHFSSSLLDTEFCFHPHKLILKISLVVCFFPSLLMRISSSDPVLSIPHLHVDRIIRYYVLFFHPPFSPSVLVKTAFSVPCTIPISPALLPFSPSRLCQQKLFPVQLPTSPLAIFIRHCFQHVVTHS
jgi:hypothetical protein